MNTEIGWVMIILGFCFLAAEALHPGFFIAVPGTVLLVMGAIFILLPGVFEQWSPIIMVVTAIVASIGTIMIYRRIAPGQKPFTTSMDTLAGKKGIVTIDIDPGSISGKVRIDNQIWSATSDTSILTGTAIEVTESEGVHVKVVEMVE
ncbi:MAG: NfeD family protein [Methanosarcinales archaeon]|nr:NfeD family protein [Methanosarcinales archaeon]